MEKSEKRRKAIKKDKKRNAIPFNRTLWREKKSARAGRHFFKIVFINSFIHVLFLR